MNKRADMLPMFWPYVTQSQADALTAKIQALAKGTDRWIGQGPAVDEFEQKFGDKFQLPYVAAMNSCSAALECAYVMLGLKPGDKVISTPMTCSATNIPLKRMGVDILWADIRQDTLNIDQESVNELFQKNDVKAIINVHLGGIESDLSEFQLDDGTPVPVIDDCAQAIGLWRPEAKFSCYSFQGIKHITTADGGILVSQDQAAILRARKLRWFGIDRTAKAAAGWQAYTGRSITADIAEPGFKWQPTDLDAVLGIAALDSFDQILSQREQIFDIYRKIEVDGFQLLDAQPGLKNQYWLATALVERRDDFAKALYNMNVETNLVQVRNDLLTIFGGTRQNLPNLNTVESKYICLPLHNRMTVEDALYVKSVIEQGW